MTLGSSASSTDGEAQVVLESKRHVLLEDADGYTLWDLDRDDDEPVATFPPTESGLDDALERWDALRTYGRRSGILTALAWVAGVIGAVWIVFTLFVIAVGLVGTIARAEPPEDEAIWFFSLTAYPFFAFMPTAFFAAAGIYVVVWMHFRRHDP